MPWVIPGIDRNKRALGTVGHTGTWIIDPNASGDLTSTVLGSGQVQQVGSLSEESPRLMTGECQLW
ncbi:MAG: transposase [Moorea sp. SIOASIH]|nr:transposase [Moorena sp. SIOASIH]